MTMPTATYDPETGQVALIGQLHTDRFHAEDLSRKLALYRGLRDRKDGRYASSYAAKVEALEGLEMQVSE